MASWLGLWAQVQSLIQEARFCKPRGTAKKRKPGHLGGFQEAGKGRHETKRYPLCPPPRTSLAKDPCFHCRGRSFDPRPGRYPACHVVKNPSNKCAHCSEHQP